MSAGPELKRWHVFTNVGRKIVLAASSSDAQRKVESCGFKVARVEYAPNPLKSLEQITADVTYYGSQDWDDLRQG